MRKMCALIATAICAICANAASTTDLREIGVADTHFAGGALASVDVSLAPIYCATGTLYAAFADSDMGKDLVDWPNVLVVAETVTEADTLINYTIPASWGSSGYKILRFFLVSSILKDGDYMARLEYVDSSTSSDINTGIKPDNNSRVEAGVMRTIDAAQIAVHGVGGAIFSTWIGSQDNLSCRFRGLAAWPNMQAKDLWYHFTQDKTGFSYVDGNGVSKKVSYNSGATSSSDATIHLFRNGTDATYCKQLRMAYWRHYTNDVLVTDYVPVLLSDGTTVGFWDLAKGEAVNCAGLTAGPQINYAPSITNAMATTISFADTAASTVSSREISIADTHIVGGNLSSVDVSLEPLFCAKGILYAAFADSDAGNDLENWPNRVIVKEVTEQDTLVNYQMPASWGSAGYRVLRFFLVSSMLKDGNYARRLEYVDSSALSDIDTGIRATSLSRIESAFMRVEDYLQAILYGGGDTDPGKHITGWLGTQADVPWRFAGSIIRPNLLSANIWYYAVQGNNATPGKTSLVVLDGNGTAKTNNYSNVDGSWMSTANIHIFRNGLNSGSGQDDYRKPVRMAYWRHYTNDVLVTDYVPVRFFDGTTAGVWDLAKGEAVNCAGLTAGPVVDCGNSITNATADVIDSGLGDVPIFGAATVSGDLGYAISASGTVFIVSGDISQVAVSLDCSADSSFSTFDRTTEMCSANGIFEISANVTPDSEYWCRLVATAPSGSATTNIMGMVTTPGRSALSSSVDVDTSNGRLLAFSGSLSKIGVAPTYILLQCGGETVASAIAADNGNWSIEWDASGDIEWTSSAIEYTVVCSNECGQSVFVSGTSGSFNLVNNSSFTWTGLGATNTWSDAGNWSCASSGDHPGCPLIGGDAIFPDNTTAEIILDVDVSIDNYAVGTTGANIKLIAEDEHALTANSYFIADMNDTAVHASTYVFSGPIALTNLMTVGMGSKVRLENGVQAYSQKGLKLCNNEIAGLSYDSVFEVFSGSEAIFGNGLNSSESMMNGNTKIVINNATLVIGFLILNINVPGGTVLLEGTNPEFRVFLRIRSQTGTTTGTGKIVFSVPEGGYAREPFRFTNTSPGNFGGFAPIFFEIAPDSPAMAANRCTTPLIFSRDTSSINTSLIDIVQPKGVTEWTVDLDDDGTPTKTVTVGWKVKRGLAIFVR